VLADSLRAVSSKRPRRHADSDRRRGAALQSGGRHDGPRGAAVRVLNRMREASPRCCAITRSMSSRTPRTGGLLPIVAGHKPDRAMVDVRLRGRSAGVGAAIAARANAASAASWPYGPRAPNTGRRHRGRGRGGGVVGLLRNGPLSAGAPLIASVSCCSNHSRQAISIGPPSPDRASRGRRHRRPRRCSGRAWLLPCSRV
jgi:hypothetical protein